MHVRFLLGPSGSGKTFRCVTEARQALLRAPIGPALLFLAPKQATFQIERQVLADADLAGYTRLHILSFEALAEWILLQLNVSTRLLSEEGRLMVLRALLAQERRELKLFRAAARLRGFAEHLSRMLRELQRHQVSPEDLRLVAAKIESDRELQFKLLDLASLLESYLTWLKTHALQDQDQLLNVATEALRKLPRPAPGTHTDADGESLEPNLWIESLWFDGFAELAPQELEFLLALLPFCQQGTLAFNLELEAVGPLSWLSPWSVVGQTFRRLHGRLSEQAGIEVVSQWLDRDGPATRFASNPVFQHLERTWSKPRPFADAVFGDGRIANALRIVRCANPAVEAREAAREILRFVRKGGRFRDAAVLVRNLESYGEPIRRAFETYEIPFFLDRRHPVGNHPLIELTRSALRTITFEWQGSDWFGLLKTGLVHHSDTDIDFLENEALARGWTGRRWLEPITIPDHPELTNRFEGLRQKLVAPLQALALELGTHPSGERLRLGLAGLWKRLDVAETLQKWRTSADSAASVFASEVHATLWQQMQDWLDNLALAFAHETLSLREWLPIVEAGLAGQTVGVIPPTLDQVLVGAVDRSRNPDLRLLVVLGVNESVLPRAPEEPILLTSADREELTRFGVDLGATTRHQMAQESYFAYIACTRARERLVLTFSQRSLEDEALNPSPLLDQLQRLFPDLRVEETAAPLPWDEVEHASELVDRVLLQAGPNWDIPPSVRDLATFVRLEERWKGLQNSLAEQPLSPALAHRLYGPVLETSVSRIEEYAACPFRFTLTSGLRVEERELFKLDARQQGSFQHEVLARFHGQLRDEKLRWRDLTPAQARTRIRTVAEALLPGYAAGLLESSEQARFVARSLIDSLEDFIESVIRWMPQYLFDPEAVELAFGLEEKPLPAWEVDLGDGHRLSFRGKIDRIDLCREPSGRSALCVVVDYKSSARKLDPLLMAHGIQMQLPAYLNVLRALTNPSSYFGVETLIPAGVFYVNLRGTFPAVRTRAEALASVAEVRAKAYQHTGRFDVSALPKLDGRKGVDSGDQFHYRLLKSGVVHGACREPLDSAAFNRLLQATEDHLKRMGREIYQGSAKADPYRKGNVTACDRCEYQGICRIDPWTHPFRVLQAPKSEF